MPINFKSFTNYFFSSSLNTATTKVSQVDNGRSYLSFNAMHNSSWAKKCAEFDPTKLAQTIRNDPRAKKAIESARKGLENLSRQMATLMKNMRTQLNSRVLYGSYQATVEERQINGQWRAFLPEGAVILPGSTFDPETRMQRISWHKDGVIWTSAYNLCTGEHTSDTGWSRMDSAGWQHSQSIDHRSGVHWHSSRHLATDQHTSHTRWSMSDANGWQSSNMFDHQTKTDWKSFYHVETNRACSETEWSKPNKDGVESRTTINHGTGTRWHETYNATTGEHLSKTDWAEDVAGIPYRTVWNHKTGLTSLERGKHTEPSRTLEYEDMFRNTDSRSAQELAVESLDILGLDKTETNKDTIKKQYRKLAIKCHPDKMIGKSTEIKEKAQEDFNKLSAAYRFLISDQFPV